MAAKKLLDFQDIYEAVLEAIGEQSSNTNALNKVKRYINMVYVDDLASFKEWKWLRKKAHIIHKAAHNDGTVSVTPGSTTVTLSTAPGASLGSFKNYYFSVEGFSEIYSISAHTAESTTVTLSSAYQGTLNTAATYKIWRDRIDLPINCARTFQLDHDRHRAQMKGVGYQELQKIMKDSPKAEGFPVWYHTTDFFDPDATADDETESDRYRQAIIFPAISETENVTIHVDYIQEVTELDLDGDEPLMPIHDRSVLYLGAVSYAWRHIARNPEEAELAWQKFEQKRARMAAEIEDGYDAPKLSINSRYRNRLRRSRIGGFDASDYFSSGAGSTGGANPNITFASDVTLNGATMTGNLVVNSGVKVKLTGFTSGSVLFVDGDGYISEDTSTINYTASTDTLLVTNATISNNMTVGGSFSATGALSTTSTLAVTSNATIGGTLGVTGVTTLSDNLVISSAKEIRLNETDNTNYIGFKAPSSVTANTTFTLPDGDGTASQYLQTNGSGTLQWATINPSTVSAAGNVDFNFVDEDTPDQDNGAILRANATTITSGAEDVDFSIITQVAGTPFTWMTFDASAGNIDIYDNVTLATGARVVLPGEGNDSDSVIRMGATNSGLWATASGAAVLCSIQGGRAWQAEPTRILFSKKCEFDSTIDLPSSPSASAPNIYFGGDTDTGWTYDSANTHSMVAGGVRTVTHSSTVVSSNLPFKFKTDTGDPSTPAAGWSYYNTTANALKLYNGSSWDTVGTTSGLPSLSVETFTSADTLDANNDIALCDASTAAFTLSLPTASGITGKVYLIKKTDSDWSKAVTIDPNGSETIGGSTTTKLHTTGEYVQIVSDGTNWVLLDRVIPNGDHSVSSPTTNLSTNVTFAMRIARDRKHAIIQADWIFSGANSDAVNANFTLPYSLNWDTNVQAQGNSFLKMGDGTIDPASGFNRPLGISYASGTTVAVHVLLVSGSAVYTDNVNPGGGVPAAFANTDRMTVTCRIPIDEWND